MSEAFAALLFVVVAVLFGLLGGSVNYCLEVLLVIGIDVRVEGVVVIGVYVVLVEFVEVL